MITFTVHKPVTPFDIGQVIFALFRVLKPIDEIYQARTFEFLYNNTNIFSIILF